MTGCSSVRDSIARYLSSNVRLTEFGGKCIVTLPITTPDNRSLSVIVEERFGMFVVHDGGKTVGEMFSRGVNLTDARFAAHAQIASSYGVTFKDGLALHATCKADRLEETLWAVAQCALLVSRDIVFHEASPFEVPIHVKVGKALNEWKPDFVEEIEQNGSLAGEVSEHRFNYISRPKNGTLYHPVAVKVFPASDTRVHAQAFAFSALDLNKRKTDARLLSIIGNSEEWKRGTVQLIDRYSDGLIESTSTSTEESLLKLGALMLALSEGRPTAIH